MKLIIMIINGILNDGGGVEMMEMINRNPTNETGEGGGNNMYINYNHQ